MLFLLIPYIKKWVKVIPHCFGMTLEQPFKLKLKRLFRLEEENMCLVQQRWQNGNWCWKWRREVRGGREEGQLRDLLLVLQEVKLTAENDRFLWRLEAEGNFTVKSTWLHIDKVLLKGGDPVTVWYKYLPKRVNIFIWRALQNRLPTRFNLSKRGFPLESICCPVCNIGGEMLDHLFFKCVLAVDLWKVIARWCNVVFPTNSSIKEWLTWVDIQRWKKMVKKRMKIIILTTCWMIWRFRNATVFDEDKIKKSSIFDSIVLYSFSWLKNRDSKSDVIWNSWMCCPFNFLFVVF